MTERTSLTGIRPLSYFGCEAVLVDPVRYQGREVSGLSEGGAHRVAHEAEAEPKPEKVGERASNGAADVRQPTRKRGRSGPRRKG